MAWGSHCLIVAELVCFSPCSFEVEEIMCGHILKVKVQYENVKMILEMFMLQF